MEIKSSNISNKRIYKNWLTSTFTCLLIFGAIYNSGNPYPGNQTYTLKIWSKFVAGVSLHNLYHFAIAQVHI